MLLFYTMIDDESDKEKFEKMYKQYKYFVFYIAYHKIQDKHYAEDIVQETFLRIAKNITIFYEISSTKTKNLVGRIALEKTIDFIRRQKTLENVSESKEDEIYSVPDKKLLPLEQLITKESYSEVVEIISQFPERDKTILQLKYIYEYSATEISKLLGITYKASTNRLYRAKRKLQILLQERGVEKDEK